MNAPTVILLTGDRVELPGGSAPGSPRVRPAKGREQIRYTGFRVGGDMYLIPGDAIGLVRSGRLDRRLFDVTELTESGYDDAHCHDLPLHRVASDRGRTETRPALTASGARVTRAHFRRCGEALYWPTSDQRRSGGRW